MTCPACQHPIQTPAYRLIAFDRPRRVNVITHPGRCQDAVRGWTAEELERYVEAQKALRSMRLTK